MTLEFKDRYFAYAYPRKFQITIPTSQWWFFSGDATYIKHETSYGASKVVIPSFKWACPLNVRLYYWISSSNVTTALVLFGLYQLS